MPKLGGLLKKKKSQDLIGLDIGSETLRMVHAKETDSRITICAVAFQKFAENADQDMGRFVHQCCREWQVKIQTASIIVPSRLFITKNVDIPSKDRQEIHKIIDLQSGRFTPYSRDEIVIDYTCVETPEQHYTNVLLVIMNRKAIERYYDVLKKSGLDIERIVIASEGLASTYSNWAAASASGDTVCGVYVSHDSSDFTVVDHHQMVFVRSMPIGAGNFLNDPQVAQKTFFEELNKSFSAFKDQGAGKFPKILLFCGLIHDLGFLEGAIKESVPVVALNEMSVQLIDGSSHFELSPKAKGLVESEKGTSFFDMFSCMASAEPLAINLIPKEVRMRFQMREGGKDVITLGVLIMTICLLLSIFLVTKIYLKREQKKKLDAISAEGVDQARTLELVSSKSRALRDLLRVRGKGLYAFEKINSLIGDDIYLTTFTYDKEGTIKFSGTAVSMSRIFAFVTELEESNYFKDVKANETKSRREGQKEVADFEIECVIAEGEE